jgi:hypothetical protein
VPATGGSGILRLLSNQIFCRFEPVNALKNARRARNDAVLAVRQCVQVEGRIDANRLY